MFLQVFCYKCFKDFNTFIPVLCKFNGYEIFFTIVRIYFDKQ